MRKASMMMLCALVAVSALAQEPKKPLSPPAKADATIGGNKLSIDYAAPSMRGRKIMGELVPYGKVWRTGANAATKLVAEGDFMIGTVHVPKGTYTLYTIPGEKDWTLIISKKTGQSGSDYDEANDFGRVKMNVKSLSAPVETFAIGLKPTSGKNGLLTLTWENTEASVPVVAH